MKKIKRICSAIAALTVLALAGCDMEVPDDDQVKYLSADISISSLPYTYSYTDLEGKTAYTVGVDSVLEPLSSASWSESDGVSLSFFLSGYTSDWSMIFQVESSNFGTTTAHLCNDEVWVANAYGCSDGNGSWDEFLDGDCFVTISLSSDGYMNFYKNGTLVTTYGGDTAPYGFAGCDAAFNVTGTDWVKNIISDISENGIYCIHPTDSWANAGAGSYTMSYFTVDKAVDAAGALARYQAYQAAIGE